MKSSLCVCLILVTLITRGCSLEPITVVGGIVAVGSALTAMWKWEPVRCRLAPCCNQMWIVNNFTGLQNDIATKLHGQHIAVRLVLDQVRNHFLTDRASKALLLSFHGPTGVGKTFLSSIIADNLYRDGLHSSFVHLISSMRDFPYADPGSQRLYQIQLQSWIESNVTQCERSLFIFEEIDKLPAGFLDVLVPYVSRHTFKDVGYNKAAFIFLSNTGSSAIFEQTLHHLRSGQHRETLTHQELKEVIMEAIEEDRQYGLWQSELIKKDLVTEFIPFLPLEKEHVMQCIRDAVSSQQDLFRYHSVKQIVDSVLEQLSFMPQEEPVFAEMGCKRAIEKIYEVIG